MRRLLGPCALFVFASAAFVTAHDDDPKPLDRLPRYEGPAFRAIDGNPPIMAMNSSGVTV